MINFILLINMILTFSKLPQLSAYNTLRSFRSKLRKSDHVSCCSPQMPKRISCQTLLSVSNLDSDKFSRQQERFISKMETWKGFSVSSSEFVTHFVAGCENVTNSEGGEQLDLTVQEAITSVLPNPITSTRNHPNGTKYTEGEWKELLLEQEKNLVIQACEPNFRHDPSLFPVNVLQLSPAELVAFGCIWFLPVTAPGDPALGQKVRNKLVSFSRLQDCCPNFNHYEASSIGS